MDRFPLSPEVDYAYESRFSDEHRGIDIMAPLGSAVLAVERGQAWSSIEPKGGKVAYLQGASGTRYFYGHLDSWVLPLISATTQKPLTVEAGDALGKVGNTGNAAGGPPHIHFQVKRAGYYGSEATPSDQTVDPFPELMAADPKRAGKVVRVASGGGFNLGQLPQGLVLIGLIWLMTRKGR